MRERGESMDFFRRVFRRVYFVYISMLDYCFGKLIVGKMVSSLVLMEGEEFSDS